ncbi:MAG: FIST C-terminal domain-containing protein, partial [Candidatus Omnitrophica bacterium]|nr:FIST C-terminal domain-containing protein [Candidatus Omnitrophota bacterium]
KIESSIRASIKGPKKKDSFNFSFLSHQINPADYINAMRLSLGNFFNLFGSGYTNKYLSSNRQILSNNIHQGLTTFAVEGIEMSSVKLNGYLPIGKPFTITKAIPDKNVIIEINNKPAINIYKKYLGEKFDLFVKNNLFSFYPLGIKEYGIRRLLNIIHFLEDGSLTCLGKVNENTHGNIMLFDSSFIINDLEKALAPIKNKNNGLVLIMNSLARKNILKDLAIEEIELIKKILGDNFNIIGLFSDYLIYSDSQEGRINLESGTSLITLWQ